MMRKLRTALLGPPGNVEGGGEELPPLGDVADEQLEAGEGYGWFCYDIGDRLSSKLGAEVKLRPGDTVRGDSALANQDDGSLMFCRRLAMLDAVKHFRDALKDLPEAFGQFAARHWVEDYDAFNSFVPVESPAAVEAWFRAEAKTDPTLLEGSGLDAEDIGVFHKNSLEKCSGVRYAYHNLGNMVLLPRVDVVLMKAAGLG